MNLLLLSPHEVEPGGRVVLTGRRHLHAREVLRAQAGDTLRVGVREGLCGQAVVVSQTEQSLELQVELNWQPPPRAGIDVILAIPRPKALKRVIPALASLGVDRVVLINAARVEKSYFDSKVLEPAFLATLIDLGLEQARDTVPPVIEVQQRFKSFIDDALEQFSPAGSAVRLVPHPSASRELGPVAQSQRVVIAIGPDGGWVPYEVELMVANGFEAVSLGQRILRVEVAVPAVIGALRAVTK